MAQDLSALRTMILE